MALALITTVSTISAQDVRALMGRQVLSDRTSEKVTEYRKSLNDSLFFTEVRKRDMYQDIDPGYDGNSTYPTVEVSKRLATQNFHIVGFGAVSTFAGYTSVGGGAGLMYGYRRWLAGGDFFFSSGEGTSAGEAENTNFSCLTGRLLLGYELFALGQKHHQFMAVLGPEFTMRSHNEMFSYGDQWMANKVKAYTLGFYGGIRYQGCPRMSSFGWFAEIDLGYGINFGDHDNGSVVTPESFYTSRGQTEPVFKFCLKVGFIWDPFNKTIRKNKIANY